MCTKIYWKHLIFEPVLVYKITNHSNPIPKMQLPVNQQHPRLF